MTDKKLGDRLSERLAAIPSVDEPQYTPKTEFDGVTGHIQTGAMENPPTDYTELLEQFGYDPTQVRIVGHPRTSRWQTYDERWLTSYRFNIAPVSPLVDMGSFADVVKQARVVRRQATGPHWFVFQAGDHQLGKISRDGSTEQIVQRYVQSVEAAKREFAALKNRGIEGIQVSIPGDCIEGNQSQGGRNQGYLTKETITEQVLIFQRLLMYTVEEFAPLAEQVKVTVVGGNHDDAQRDLNTVPGNNWATTAATLVHDRLGDNPLAFGHVQVLVPDKWSGAMTVPIGDTVVTVVHGHQWRPGQGMKWWSGQALGNLPPGGSQILQCGHYHSWEIETTADRTLIQSPTFDCGSDWYREKTGATGRRGALTYLLKSGEVSCMSVV